MLSPENRIFLLMPPVLLKRHLKMVYGDVIKEMHEAFSQMFEVFL